MRRPSYVLIAALAVATAIPACVGRYKSDFQIIVINRITNNIQVLANGKELGEVAAGQQSTFTMRLNETNSNTFTDGVAPTATSGVTLNAKDLKTGALSSTKDVQVSQSSPSYITFAAADFPAAVPTVARFTVSPNSPGVNQDVQFNASASTPSNATFSWTFGDGTGALGVTTTHRYQQVGSYVVTLTVRNDTGQTATATATVNVSTTPQGQVANFTFSPAAPAVNQDIFFNASTSTVSAPTFAWDFGDGTTGTGVTITKRYSRSGTFTVTLRATNPAGQTAATSRAVTVSSTSASVIASFTFSPSSPAVHQQVFFNASASRPENGSYVWNFGDGTTGTGVTPVHIYDTAGAFTVTLTVINDVGQSATTTRTVTVTATSAQVSASFVFSPTAPAVNQDVFFDASASRPTDATFSWNFGDGTSGSGVAPAHRYAAAGTYTVLLVVTNDFGQTATTTRTVTVSATSAQVVASFVFSPTVPGIEQDVFFDASASRPADASLAWNFGDGRTGTGVTPTHRYTLAGTYTVVLVVTNQFGQSASTSRTITVTSTTSQVVANFTFSPTNPAVNQDVFFNASGSRPTDATFSWNFGDGTTGTGMTPIHRYASAATYSVTLTVTNSVGQFATTQRTVPVAGTVLTADFTFSPTDPTISKGTNTVTFDATPSSSSAVSYVWDFGDGTPAQSGLRTAHTFTQQGTWVVRLTVTDAEGRSATTTKNVTVAQ